VSILLLYLLMALHVKVAAFICETIVLPYAGQLRERAMARKPTELRPVMTRIPEGLRRRLEKEATRSDRSMNAEIIERLERSFSYRKTDALAAGLTGGPDNANILRLVAIALSLAGQWKDDTERSDALRIAIDYLVAAYAGLPRGRFSPPAGENMTTKEKLTEALSDEPLQIYEAEISGCAIAETILKHADLNDPFKKPEGDKS
jgi:Arc-like DNA binding domain